MEARIKSGDVYVAKEKAPAPTEPTKEPAPKEPTPRESAADHTLDQTESLSLRISRLVFEEWVDQLVKFVFAFLHRYYHC